MYDLADGHIEYKLAANCALTKTQGPVSGANNRTDIGFFGGRLHPRVTIENMGWEWVIAFSFFLVVFTDLQGSSAEL